MQSSLGLIVIVSIIALLIVALLVDRLLLWMERRGWIYYRSFEPRLAARNMMSTFQEIVHPEVRHVHDEQRQREAGEVDQTLARGADQSKNSSVSANPNQSSGRGLARCL